MMECTPPGLCWEPPLWPLYLLDQEAGSPDCNQKWIAPSSHPSRGTFLPPPTVWELHKHRSERMRISRYKRREGYFYSTKINSVSQPIFSMIASYLQSCRLHLHDLNKWGRSQPSACWLVFDTVAQARKTERWNPMKNLTDWPMGLSVEHFLDFLIDGGRAI